MTTNNTIEFKKFADLNQMTTGDVLSLLGDYTAPKTITPFKTRFTYADALEIELARQLNDKSGIPIPEAFRLSTFTTAVRSFFDDKAEAGDFWLAVVAARNTWGDAPRGSWAETSFGRKEFWSEMHFTGSLAGITADISEAIESDRTSYPDSDPARVFMANVSTADRRLRRRAASLGIAVIGNDFAD